MLSDHDRTGRRWSGHCGGCLEAILPREGTREDVERELVAEGWELVAPDQIRCVACSRRAREVKEHDARGRRRR